MAQRKWTVSWSYWVDGNKTSTIVDLVEMGFSKDDVNKMTDTQAMCEAKECAEESMEYFAEKA